MINSIRVQLNLKNAWFHFDVDISSSFGENPHKGRQVDIPIEYLLYTNWTPLKLFYMTCTYETTKCVLV